MVKEAGGGGHDAAETNRGRGSVSETGRELQVHSSGHICRREPRRGRRGGLEGRRWWNAGPGREVCTGMEHGGWEVVEAEEGVVGRLW
jgi:hypothetical protein